MLWRKLYLSLRRKSSMFYYNFNRRWTWWKQKPTAVIVIWNMCSLWIVNANFDTWLRTSFVHSMSFNLDQMNDLAQKLFDNLQSSMEDRLNLINIWILISTQNTRKKDTLCAYFVRLVGIFFVQSHEEQIPEHKIVLRVSINQHQIHFEIQRCYEMEVV